MASRIRVNGRWVTVYSPQLDPVVEKICPGCGKKCSVQIRRRVNGYMHSMDIVPVLRAGITHVFTTRGMR